MVDIDRRTVNWKLRMGRCRLSHLLRIFLCSLLCHRGEGSKGMLICLKSIISSSLCVLMHFRVNDLPQSDPWPD